MFESSALNAACGTGATGVLLALAYRAVRYIRGDQRKDRVDQAADDLRKELAEQIALLKLDVKTLTERCDRFAAERNDAVAEAAALSATVDGLKSRLEDVMEDRKRAHQEMMLVRERNEALVLENTRLQASVKTLTDLLTRMTGMPAYDWNNVVEALPRPKET